MEKLEVPSLLLVGDKSWSWFDSLKSCKWYAKQRRGTRSVVGSVERVR
jgi:hypothetical protein